MSVRSKSAQFQSKDFNFPKFVYVGCISIVDSAGHSHNACLTRVFDNLDILKRYALFVINDLSKSIEGIGFTYQGFLIKAKFNRLFSLNKTHWKQKSADHPLNAQNFRNDVNIIKYWEMSELLVTPDGESDGVEFFSFCVSLFKDTPDTEIDLFIKNSDHSVDTRATNAALYTLEKPEKIDWLENSHKFIAGNWEGNYIN